MKGFDIMKKLLCISLAVLFIVSAFVGCSSKSNTNNNQYDDTDISPVTEETSEETTAKESVNSSTDWHDFIVVINGVEIQLPISYQEFKAKTGYVASDEIDSEDKSVLAGHSDEGVPLWKDTDVMFCDLRNTGDEDATLADCTIYALNVNYSNHDDIKFVNNWSVGMELSQDDVISVFGEPQNVLDMSGYTSLEYREDAPRDNIDNIFSIDISEDGTVERLELYLGQFLGGW